MFEKVSHAIRPIAEEKIGVRLANVLWKNNIHTVGDVATLTRKEFRSLKNCGESTTKEMEELLAKYGLEFTECIWVPGHKELKRRIQKDIENTFGEGDDLCTP